MLIKGVNPLLQLTVVYPFALYGSVFSDLDHNWQSAPCKDPVSFAINKALHATSWIRKKTDTKSKVVSILDAKHRSWQTHSDLFLIGLIAAFIAVLYSGLSGTSWVLFELMSVGFITGVVSHILLDMLTPEGIWVIIPSILRRKKVMLSLVPKSKFFSTGGRWEMIVRFLLWAAIAILFVRVLYLASPYRITFQ